MSLLNSLGSILSQGLSELNKGQQQGQSAFGGQGGSSGFDIVGQVLNGLSGNAGAVAGPTILGGLAGALLGNKAMSGALGGALLMGGMQLWNQYRQRLQEENAKGTSGPAYAATPSSTEERSLRIIRALIYAAKSDGHIDDEEQQAISAQLQKMNMGEESAKFIQEAIEEPLDPALIAEGIRTPDEALEIFAISCAVLNIDNFMERSYLDALANALNIPEDVKTDLISKVRA